MDWQPIETAPVTNSPMNPWGRIRCMFYSKELGIVIGDLIHEWQLDCLPKAFITNYTGDAVKNWGVTHWKPLPEPPK